jgi:hypothetical protein
MSRDSDAPGENAPQLRAVVTAGLLIVGSLVAIGLYAWFSFGDMAMTTSGYIALALGVIGTMALAIGLMSLVFFSNRSGYDAQVGRRDQERGRE